MLLNKLQSTPNGRGASSDINNDGGGHHLGAVLSPKFVTGHVLPAGSKATSLKATPSQLVIPGSREADRAEQVVEASQLFHAKQDSTSNGVPQARKNMLPNLNNRHHPQNV